MGIRSRCIVFTDDPPKLELVEGPLPELKPGEILVKLSFTSLCRSDVNTYVGKRREKTPTILGHECVGEIVRFASENGMHDARGRALHIGRQVTWGIFSSDPADPMSVKGIPQKAADLFKYGHELLSEREKFHGGLAEYIILRPNTPVVALSGAISLPAASLINCSVATVAAAFRLAGPVAGKGVMVTGCGMLGVIACAMASHLNAHAIHAVDISGRRIETARRFGATETFLFQHIKDSLPKSDIVMDFSGSNEAMLAGLAQLETGGTAVWAGATFPQEPLALSAEDLIRRIITLRGIHNYNVSDLVSAVEFMESTNGRYDFSSLVEKTFGLGQTGDAFRYAVENNPYRVGVTFND
jgi:putative phosphonate catabolism associated alcohol dehydrogenase